MEVRGAVGEVMAINWRDKEGGWTEFIRIRVKIDTPKPLRRVVCIMDSVGANLTCVIKYERLVVFCYIFGHVGHNTKKCSIFSVIMEPKEYQFSNWMRVPMP